MRSFSPAGVRRALAALAASGVALGIGGFAALDRALPARADTVPAAGTPATVSADPLPTAQINGVVWAQVVTGDTVWATGSFTKARPAGVPIGGPGEVAAANLVSFSISTGRLTSFQHVLNGQGLGLTASPDSAKVYVVGDFTTVDGVARNHAAAFDARTGALDPTFRANVNARATAVQATPQTVYIGGNFDAVGGQRHLRLAAVDATSGAVVSAWAPSADDLPVSAMVLTPDRSRLIVGGHFTSVNQQPAFGLVALDPATGATRPWAAALQVQDSGLNSGITSLSTDGTNVYATGYNYRGAIRSLEGTLAADPDTGVVRWMEDCHGDTYGAFGVNGVVYTVSHSHYCGSVGGFPQTNPWTYKRAMAWTQQATHTLAHNEWAGYTDWFGQPAPSLLPFWPTLTMGTFTQQGQAAWSVTGNATYVVMGGEFPAVNGRAQQGLVRFAVSAAAPNKVIPVIPGGAMGPQISTTNGPTGISLSPGTVRLAWTQTWDQDNESLRYDVYRDGAATPVYSVTSPSAFWTVHNLGFTDTGLTPGSTHTYRVRVSDPFANHWTSPGVSVVVDGATPGAYPSAVVGDGASSYWRLDELSGPTAYDHAGVNDATEGAGVGHPPAGALIGDPDRAAAFPGDATGVVTSTPPAAAQPAPASFGLEAWFKTTSTTGGKLIGFGDQPGSKGLSLRYDRHVYLTNSGQVVFGVASTSTLTLASAKRYNDGAWHHVVAGLGGGQLSLYVDDQRIGTAAVGAVASYPGYWRIGGDNLQFWPAAPAATGFTGTIDEVAIYPAPLTPAQIDRHWVLSGRTTPAP